MKISPLDGEEQQHRVSNAFNILANEGFLRDQQGVQTLEVVNEFYKIIEQELKRATLKVSNLLSFCGKISDHEVEPKPVITLTKTENGETFGHAVVLKSYDRSEDYLDLITIDSLSATGETSVECPISSDGDNEILALGEFPDQWCLASEKCYYFHFN